VKEREQKHGWPISESNVYKHWVYLHEYQTVAEAKKRLGEYFCFYNEERLHEALDYRTPSEVYFGTPASLIPTAAMAA
jgi:transposase InsO family protein